MYSSSWFSWLCLSRTEITDLCHHPCFKHPCCPTYWEVRVWRKRHSGVFLFFFHVTMSDMSNWLVWETNQGRKDNDSASWLPCSSYFFVWSKFHLRRKPWPPWVVSLFVAKRGPSTCAVWVSLNTPWSQSTGILFLGRSTALRATVWQGRWTHTWQTSSPWLCLCHCHIRRQFQDTLSKIKWSDSRRMDSGVLS